MSGLELNPLDFVDMATSKERSDALAEHLAAAYFEMVANAAAAQHQDLAPGVHALVAEVNPAEMVSFVLETISEAWFWHPELLAPYAGDIVRHKTEAWGEGDEAYRKMATGSTFLIAAALAAVQSKEELAQALIRMMEETAP